VYVVIAGAGKVGWNLARELISKGHEVTVIESERSRYLTVEQELEHAIQYGDATELWVLERAGINRADLTIAVTGDDEDNLVISQLPKEAYGVRKAIARVNDPRNQQHFDLLGITQTVCATTSILGLVEHEVPEHGLVRLLELQKEGLVVVEVQVEGDSPAAGAFASTCSSTTSRPSLRSSSSFTRPCCGTSCSTRPRRPEVAHTVWVIPRRSKCCWFRGSLTRAIAFLTP